MSDILTRNGFLSLLEKIERWGSTETSHRTLTAHDAALRAERDAALARAKEITAVCEESNAVCICGCPEQAHEIVDEGAEGCGRDDHECLRTSAAVAALYRSAIARAEKLEADIAKLQRWADAGERSEEQLAETVVAFRKERDAALARA